MSCCTEYNRPFKTEPKTYGDRVRSMDDEELATLFFALISELEHRFMEKLAEAGIDADLIEFPYDGIQAHLDLMRSPYTP